MTTTRITPADLEAQITDTYFFTAREGAEARRGGGGTYPVSMGVLTICVLVLKNGFTVVGKSACVDPASFNREIGESVARADAVEQMWPLLGYALKDQLHRDALAQDDML